MKHLAWILVLCATTLYAQTAPNVYQGSSTNAFSGNVVAGHALYAVSFFGDISSNVSFVDTQGNPWSTVSIAKVNGDGDMIVIGCTIATYSAPDTVINYYNGKVGGPIVATLLYEIAGASCTPDVSPVSSDTFGATSCNSGSVSTTTANDFLLGICMAFPSGNYFTAGAGWSNTQYVSNFPMMGEVQVASSPGTYQATSGTFSLSSTEQTSVLIAFKPNGTNTATPVIVQSTPSAGAGPGNPLTPAIFSKDVVAGHALYAAFSFPYSDLNVTFTDSQGNSWMTLATANLDNDGDTIAVGCTIAQYSSGDSVTAYGNGGDGTDGLALEGAILYEVAGASCTPDVAPIFSNTLNTTSCNSGAAMTSTANDLLLGICMTPSSGNTLSSGAGWSNIENTGNLFGEAQIASTPGLYQATSSSTFPATEQTTILLALAPAKLTTATSPPTTVSTTTSTTTSTTYTVVQQAATTPSMGTTTFPNTVTAGNALYVAFGIPYQPQNVNITDSQGNSWNTAATAYLQWDGDEIVVGCTIAQSSASNTVMLASNGTSVYVSTAVLYEVAGGSCNLDVTPVSSNTGDTHCSSGSLTTITPNDFMLGFCMALGSWNSNLSSGFGWSNAQFLAPFFGETQIATSPGTYQATSSVYSGEEQTTIILAFKPNSSSSSTTTTTTSTPTTATTTVYSYQIPSYDPSQIPTGYDAASNIVGYTDSVNGTWGPLNGTAGFTYDQLNRLTSASGVLPNNTSVQSCWTYDAFGNRTMSNSLSATCSNQTSSTLIYDANNHVVSVVPPGVPATSASTSSQHYDFAGNVTDDPAGNTYLYDAEGRICAVQSSSGTGAIIRTGYIYNAAGERVSKGSITSLSCDLSINGFTASATDYIIGPNGQQLTEVSYDAGGSSTWQRTYIYAGNQLIGEYGNNGTPLNFRLTDWLGSLRVTTNGTGKVLSTCSNMPFGDGLSCTGSSDTHHFTAKERDTESGNDYFGARYMASSMGRFLSPDYSDSDPYPVPSADFDNPQSLNLYSYVHNNPLINVDPDGHDCIVQTRTSDTTETVSRTSGNCDNVKVGDGQTKTYVDGVVDMSSVKGDKSGGITFNYTSYSGDAGVADLKGAPMPDNPGIAYGFGNNAQGYQTLGAAKTTVDYATAFVGATAGSVGLAIAGGEIAAGTAAARSQIIFRLAHGLRVAGSTAARHSQVLAETGAVKNAIASAIASGAIEKIGNGFQGVVNVAGTYIRFTGGWNPAGQIIVSNIMGAALQR